MKARKIVIFIFGILAALALVCAIFPRDGITIGNIHFEFPSMHEVLEVKTDTSSMESADDLYKKQMEAMKTNDDKQFKQFAASNPARFHMPNNDLAYFDELFEAMENASSEPMRILHYGDSQLEGDRISSDFRERLQTAFGGSGVGMVPAVQAVGAMTVVQTASPKLHQYFSYNMGDHLSNGRYGIMSQVAHLNGSAQFSFRSSSLEGVPHSKTFTKVTMVCSGTGKATLNANGTSLEMTDPVAASDGMKFLSATLGTPANKVSVSASGKMEIFGIMLDGNKGISLDNVPMRGCSGTVFTITDRNTLEPFFKRNNVKLIILQYGGNSVPYMKREKAFREYKQGLIAQINLFKSMAPDAKILFIGPADMSTNVKGKKETYPQLVPTIKLLEEVCTETGVAFWNLYEAMGGHNSMIKWVEANLAGRDYLHFTRDGASKVADMLFNTYLMYYRYYCRRVGKTPKDFGDTQDGDTLQNKEKE